ncbi:GIY-YIG nuclease family protein [bacterium]|jgi:hypothetical protein|nr:GIY-YIG nuclease family protein [bacterium]
MSSGIYKIKNKINNKCYIGSAINILGRFATHKSSLNKNKHHSYYLQQSWNKYGIEFFIFEILEYCEKNILLEREQYYMDLLNPEYNMCKIAGSCLGIKGTPESNLKKSINHAFKGKYGKEHPSSKPVFQYEQNGNFVKKWENPVQIQNELHFDSGNIRKSIKNRWVFYNYFWSYAFLGDIYNGVPKRRDRSKTRKPIIQYDLNNNFIKEWDSAKSATTYLGKRDGSLSCCLKNKVKKMYGYIWKYKI